MHDRSRSLFERSLELIPGGVNSPVRAFRSVGGRRVEKIAVPIDGDGAALVADGNGDRPDRRRAIGPSSGGSASTGTRRSSRRSDTDPTSRAVGIPGSATPSPRPR